jgi:hypothetical protein
MRRAIVGGPGYHGGHGADTPDCDRANRFAPARSQPCAPAGPIVREVAQPVGVERYSQFRNVLSLIKTPNLNLPWLV